jgi:3-deoxy-7-phosphoheptulonate synthase
MIVDCSHGNANKQYERQEVVWNDLVQQRATGNQNIIGMMVESNLKAGTQKIPSDRSLLHYGVSVTDPCVDWETTERMLRHAHAQMKEANGF